MKRPSERALDLAEEILNHVRHGLTRNDELYELAEMIDDHDADLVSAVQYLLYDAEHDGGIPGPSAVARVKDTVADYQPPRTSPKAQAELFAMRFANA